MVDHGTRRVVVRDPEVADAEALATAHVRAWQVGYQGILPPGYLAGIDVAARAEQWRGWLADGAFRATRVSVATLDGAPVGFAIHGPERLPDDPDGGTGAAQADGPSAAVRDGELYALNVHPDHWGCGAGTALLERVHAALADAGHTEAVLWVLPQNGRGRRFYERHGWQPDGTSKVEELAGTTVEEIRYRRPLG